MLMNHDIDRTLSKQVGSFSIQWLCDGQQVLNTFSILQLPDFQSIIFRIETKNMFTLLE